MALGLIAPTVCILSPKTSLTMTTTSFTARPGKKRSLGGASPISFQAAGCLGNKWERALDNICMRV